MVSSSGRKWGKTFSILVLLVLNMRQAVAIDNKKVPCYFIFGDSLVDNGNNNNLQTQAKANYPPYGVDYPLGPTGRFTNGRTTADVTAELLGFDEHIPPYATASGQKIIQGVNYGSGGAGILDETGSHQGEVNSLDKQLKQHSLTILQLSKLLRGVTITEEYLGKCYYTVGMGNNDYINNYLLPEHYGSSNSYTPDQFADLLVTKYAVLLKRLYILGARKVAISGLGNVGFVPMYASRGPAKVDLINKSVRMTDAKIKSMVNQLNTLPQAKFFYIDVAAVSIANPTALGIKDLGKPCCEISINTSPGQCITGGVACPNRRQNVFFDNFHPTEVINVITATKAFNASRQFFFGAN